MTSPSLRRLAERLSEVERQITAFNAPQLGSSSIEGGAVEAYTPDGQLTLRVGQQHDGTNTAVVLAGPTPPTPVGLTVTGGQRSATATWDGTWEGDAVSPMDFARVEVHVTPASVSLPDPGFDSATRVGSIESQAGASLTFALDPGESWVWLIARAQSGKASDPGGPVRVEVADAIDAAAVEEARNKALAAQDAANAAMSVAGSKTRIYTQDTMPSAPPEGFTVGDLWIDNGPFTPGGGVGGEDIGGGITKRWNGTTWVRTEQTFDAAEIRGGWLKAGIGIWAGGSIVAGQIFGKCAKMDANGFSTLQVAEDGTQYTSTSLGGSGKDALAIFRSNDEPPVFEVSEDGAVSAADLTVADDITVAGRSLVGQLFDAAGDPGWLDDLPRGVIGRGSLRPLVSGKSVTNGFQDLGIMSFTVQPGRSYRITLPYAYVPTLSSGAQAQVALIAFYTLGTTAAPQPADPTRSSGRLGQSSGQITLSTTSYPLTDVVSFVFDAVNTVPVEMRILFSAFAGPNLTMGYSVSDNTSWVAFIEDVGTSVPDTARLVTAPSISTYTKTYTASDSRSYNGDGSPDTFGNGKTILRHGQYLSGNGNLRSAVVFPAAMSTDLSGATIRKAEIYVESLHWYASTGGTARFFPMTGSTLPGSITSVPGSPVVKKFTARNQGFWLQVPTSWFSASNRGFIIGPAADSSANNYGYFAAHNHSKTTARPKIRITYTK